MSSDIQKADQLANQLAFHFYTKLFYTINQARSTEESKSTTRTDKWFNLETPDSDLFTSEARQTYKAISQAPAPGPPPLEIQTLLSIPELSDDQKLTCISPDSSLITIETTQRFILLEKWMLTMTPHDHDTLSAGVSIPVAYKHAIVLFRSVFSLLRILPAWNLCTLLKSKPGNVNRNGQLGIKLRVGSSGELEGGEPIVGFDARLSPMLQSPLPVSTYTFPPVEHPLGSFTLSTTFLTTADFRLDATGSLLSSQLIPTPAQSFIIPTQVLGTSTPPLTFSGTTARTSSPEPPSPNSEFGADPSSTDIVADSPHLFLGFRFQRFQMTESDMPSEDNEKNDTQGPGTGPGRAGGSGESQALTHLLTPPRKRYSSRFEHRYSVADMDSDAGQDFDSVPEIDGYDAGRSGEGVDSVGLQGTGRATVGNLDRENHFPLFASDRDPEDTVKSSKVEGIIPVLGSDVHVPNRHRQGKDDGDHGESLSRWVAAERASSHVGKNIKRLREVLAKWEIQESQYAIYAGFDESLIQAGVGYLEQIHILSSAPIAGNSSLLSDLGKITSPFSAILFTESASFRVPVYKDIGSTYDFDELVHFTALKFIDGGSSTVPTISVAQNSNQANSSAGPPPCGSAGHQEVGKGNESGEGGKGGSHGGGDKPNERKGSGGRGSGDDDRAEKGDEEDQDPGDDPDEPVGSTRESTEAPQVSFDIVSEICRNGAETNNSNILQSLTTEGIFTIQTMPHKAHPQGRFSKSQIQFTKLNFGSHRTIGNSNMAYRQFHLRVTIDSQQKNADVTVIKPLQSVAFEREAKELSATKASWAIGTSLGATIGLSSNATMMATTTRTSEVATSLEKKRYTSRITQQTKYGVVWWGFEIDDPYEQEEGVKLSDPTLPAVEFEYLGDSDIPAPPPKHIHVEVATYWSIIRKSGEDANWMYKILSRSTSNAGSYSNLCQIVTMVVPSNLKDRADYRATMHVNSGQHGSNFSTNVRRQTGTLDATPAVSWGLDTTSISSQGLRNQSLLKLPTLG
ncbi:hypothetical protein GALMADRAFT_259488 [Galerina marginata CBS 339.88]|uniref:Autophagy-related protein 13 n=1 Tax=Galerina marginata (strain CBS 339.88) TaxID=685588 RepID=A0A067S6A0_GALM3|nr:hypothetical protein GALMADRAFT_259488 [Galerina marginata CBS 339.88]